MTREELQAVLAALPEGTEVYVRQGDNAWPAGARVFRENGVRGGKGVVLYLEVQRGGHRNFPEGYSGAEEVPVPGV